MSRRLCSVHVLGVLVLLAGTVLPAQQQPAITEALLRQSPPGEWITHGRDYAEQRHSPLREIDATNVSRLGPAWTSEIGTGGGNQEATPLVSNGVMFVITNWSIVYALDARTGRQLWRFDPQVNRAIGTPGDPLNRVCCGIVNRGLALWQDRVFVPAIDGRLIALNVSTGVPLWEVMTVPTNEPYSVTMAPRVVKGRVVVGNSGGEFGVRGYVSAYDAQDGRLVWRFYTVPGDPSKPYEHPDLEAAARTWSGEWWKMGGGGTVWDALAFDPDADLLYIGVGNGSPWSRDLRSAGQGDNWYLSSIVAVKPDTGQYVWHYQTTPGDSWDYTAVQHMILADVRINGENRKVIMQAPKNGFFYVLDRITGQFISAQPFAEVSWASGIDANGRPIVNPEAWYGFETVVLAPGPFGAHNWPPMSFNPATGLVYIPGANSTGNYAKVPGFEFATGTTEGFTGTGRMQLGVAMGRGRGGPAVPSPPTIGPEGGRGAPGGFLLAWDPIAQRERWRQPGGSVTGGGTLSTAGNLVLHTVSDGRLVAYRADTGEKLTEIATGVTSAGPPMTYELDGRQYVAFLGGRGGGAAPTPAGQAGVLPGTAGASTPQRGAGAAPAAASSQAPRVMTFTLGATAALPGTTGR
jgi:quinohemoprotein ethanol dehydrogenase